TRDWFATTMVVLGIAVLGFYASHKPRQQTYRLDEHGLTIDRRRYGYEQFRSFAVVSEGAFSSIELAPLGRFATYMTIYYAPADEAKIVDVLSAHLPVEPPHNDLTDQLLRRIHF
ncbi:MAG TPA: hypothetical protein VHC98_00390, partial [Candidatus Saccharimonadales bacterium]|nr:hypothetical protein [Candidatus Saccharimonadales bacterium]